MNHVTTVRSDAQHHLEDNRGAEQSGRLDRVDSPQGSFTDREHSNLLQCRNANGCTIKCRGYG